MEAPELQASASQALPTQAARALLTGHNHAAAAVTLLTLFMSRSWPVADARQSRLPSGHHCAPASPPDNDPTYKLAEKTVSGPWSTQGVHCAAPAST